MRETSVEACDVHTPGSRSHEILADAPACWARHVETVRIVVARRAGLCWSSPPGGNMEKLMNLLKKAASVVLITLLCVAVMLGAFQMGTVTVKFLQSVITNVTENDDQAGRYHTRNRTNRFFGRG